MLNVMKDIPAHTLVPGDVFWWDDISLCDVSLLVVVSTQRTRDGKIRLQTMDTFVDGIMHVEEFTVGHDYVVFGGATSWSCVAAAEFAPTC